MKKPVIAVALALAVIGGAAAVATISSTPAAAASADRSWLKSTCCVFSSPARELLPLNKSLPIRIIP